MSFGGCGTVRERDRYRVGIDVGGTFTDIVAVSTTNGNRIALKTPTVPRDQASGVARGLELLEQRGVRPDQIEYFANGTTIALNALIQRAGARIALIVTDGFRDVLELGRVRLPIPWDFYSHRPEPLVPRALVLPVRERLRADGSVETELTDGEIQRLISRIATLKVEGVVISLLHSYKNASHESRIKQEIAAAYPNLLVSTSTEVWPQIREYERTLAAVVNGYVRPELEHYIAELEQVLLRANVAARPYLTRSNGGIMTSGAAKRLPVATLVSGPASGVIGATRVAGEAGFNQIITFDMGGTSVDVGVVDGGRVVYNPEQTIAGFPMVLPAIGISSIGAGGGSIAWLDTSGVLRVGPQSAGADPGPACYGQGGIDPTLSDAFLICGYLNANSFPSRKLDMAAARAAMSTIAEPLGLSLEDTSDSVIQVALANMYTELSGVVERNGLDPRDYTLVAFGGAGPVLARQLAAEIGVNTVLIPPSPGTLCALGALQADVMSDFVKSVNWQVRKLPPDDLEKVMADLNELASIWLDSEAPASKAPRLEWFVEARYTGQSHQIAVDISAEALQAWDSKSIAEAFHAAHQRTFFHSDASAPVEIVDLRIRAVVATEHVKAQSAAVKEGLVAEPRNSRTIRIDGVELKAMVFEWSDLRPGHHFGGPAILEQPDSTSVFPVGWLSQVDANYNVISKLERR